jgi:hypothetical protein
MLPAENRKVDRFRHHFVTGIAGVEMVAVVAGLCRNVLGWPDLALQAVRSSALNLIGSARTRRLRHPHFIYSRGGSPILSPELFTLAEESHDFLLTIRFAERDRALRPKPV